MDPSDPITLSPGSPWEVEVGEMDAAGGLQVIGEHLKHFPANKPASIDIAAPGRSKADLSVDVVGEYRTYLSMLSVSTTPLPMLLLSTGPLSMLSVSTGPLSMLSVSTGPLSMLLVGTGPLSMLLVSTGPITMLSISTRP